MSTPMPDDIPSARQRLADIGHHFISEPDEVPSPWQGLCPVPLLLLSRSDDYLAWLLQAALRRRGRRCAVLNLEVDGANAAIPSGDGLCLLPVTSPASLLAIPHRRLLMAVPASLPGVRLAYHRLALLAEQGRGMSLDVIMLDARNRGHGERYFDFLGNSAGSLLSLRLQLAGVLCGSPNDDHDAAGHIAEAVLRRDWRPQHAALPQAAGLGRAS